MQEIWLKKIDANTNTDKFYRLVLPMGSHDLLVQWGRIGSWVEEQWLPCGSAEAANKAYTKKLASKLKEGYEMADSSVLPTSYRQYGQKRQPEPEPPRPKQHPGQLSWLDLLKTWRKKS
jgi:predicted DNA-binding WGR domain protein